jgi:uncharacterized surface protein with fasciclin (FAS1) repeats
MDMDPQNIVEFAANCYDYTTVAAAVQAAGMDGALTGKGPFTVFAPTNAAFQALLDTDDNWNELADIPVATLESVLSYHVSTAGNVRSTDLMDEMVVPTLSEES